MATKNAAEYTSYPAVFSKTVWGQLLIKPAPQIIAFRDSFVTQCNIKNAITIPEVLICKKSYLFEHPECYSMEDGGRVIVLSPAVVTDSKIKDAKALGFRSCSGLWFIGKKSFVITFKDVKAYNAFLKKFAD